MSQKGKMGTFGTTGFGDTTGLFTGQSYCGISPFLRMFRLGAIADARSIFFLARRARKKCEKFTWREKFHFFTFAFFTTISRFETLKLREIDHQKKCILQFELLARLVPEAYHDYHSL